MKANSWWFSTSEKEPMHSIASTKDNTWEEMTEPTTSRHGEVGGDLLKEVLEILVLGTIKTSDPLTTSPTQECSFVL